MYITAAEYDALSMSHSVPADDVDKRISSAERDIDGMTFGRIRHSGLDALTEFQQALVKQSVVDQMDFQASYGAMLGIPLASYSINGVSMAWDKSRLKQIAGVYTTNDIASHLMQTGLMCGRIR